MLSRHPLPTTRPSAPTRRHQTRHWHLPLLPHPRRPRRHCCWPPPHRTNHHSCPRLTNLLTRCKHSARKRLRQFAPPPCGARGLLGTISCVAMTGCGEVPTRSLADAAQQHVGLFPVAAGSCDCEIDSLPRRILG